MAKNRRGFTLIELVVVVLVMGILASVGVPYYYKTIETSKATDSLALGHLLGNANRMYRIDNPALLSGQITNTCNTTGGCATTSGACKLVACNYVAAQDWSSSAYNFFACDGSSGGSCCGTSAVACAVRKAGAPAAYSGWGYRFLNDGSCVALAGSAQPSCPKF